LKSNSSSILIDYYNGAYGPTIRIDVRSDKDLFKFKELIFSLANAEKNEIMLGEISSIKLSGMKNFNLILDKKEKSKKLELVNGEFIWSLHRDGWQLCLDWIEGIVEPGHQYLTEEGVDDALSELVFIESV